MKQELLRLDNVSQHIDGNAILKNINFTVNRSEIVGLMHLSYLGVYPLVDLICHNSAIDFGCVYYDRKLVNTYRYTDNTRNPVAIVSEDCRLCCNVSVADNLLLAKADASGQLYQKKQAYADAQKLLTDFGVDTPPETETGDLSPCQRSIIEMLCAYIRKQKLIILLEPEAFVGENELKVLLAFVRLLSCRGVSFLYIGSYSENQFSVCDRLILMDKGSVIKVLDKYHMDSTHLTPYLSSLQVEMGQPSDAVKPKIILSFRGISTASVTDFSCDIHKGSCTVLIDELGKATRDIIDVMGFRQRPLKGKILLDGKPFLGKRSSDIIRNQIAFIRAHPTQTELFTDMSYIDNLCMLLDLRRHAVLKRSNVLRSIMGEYRDRLGKNLLARNLHGMDEASLYDLVYYRIQLMHPKVVFIDCPFAEHDLLLRSHVQSLIRMLKADGITVVLFTMSSSNADTGGIADQLVYISNVPAR